MTAEEAEAAIAQRLPSVLELTERELTEIKHALFYFSECNHGTVGHNMLIIIAKMAIDRGFRLSLGDSEYELTLPQQGVEIVSK
jgi:hypothetical protein